MDNLNNDKEFNTEQNSISEEKILPAAETDGAERNRITEMNVDGFERKDTAVPAEIPIYNDLHTNERIISAVTEQSIFHQMPETEGKTKKRGKTSNFGKAAAVFALVAVLGGSTFGLGFGFGSGGNMPWEAAFKHQTAESSTADEIPSKDIKDIEDEQPLKAEEPRISESSGEVVIQADPPAIVSNDLHSLAISPGTASVAEIYKKVSSAVVSINVKGSSVSMFNQTIPFESAGSGIIFKEDGEKVYIVTNYHVISGANAVSISLDDAIQASANFVGGRESDDIAVISVDKAEMVKAGITEYAIAAFADSDAIEIGDTAIAIGNALGEGKSATLGIVSAVNKQINIDRQMLSVIQTDAAINPGNSGGALVNGNGQVIGINTAKLSNSGFTSVEGMGYAIPSNTVNTIINDILGSNKIDSPYLGVEVRTITEDLKIAYNFPSYGVYVNYVDAGSSAEEGGIRQGDIIISVDGKEITTSEELSSAIQASKVGGKLKIGVIRNGRTSVEVEVTLKNKGLNF